MIGGHRSNGSYLGHRLSHGSRLSILILLAWAGPPHWTIRRRRVGPANPHVSDDRISNARRNETVVRLNMEAAG
jgi:hypothetical protein